MTDFGGKTSIFSHPVYLFLRKFSLQDSRGGSVTFYEILPHCLFFTFRWLKNTISFADGLISSDLFFEHNHR
ncbi:hypothetical protein C5U37_22995 [Escherichia fergusonii]|nr:hypothetical protein C5U37_22995 [Escherichia fergusonii]